VVLFLEICFVIVSAGILCKALLEGKPLYEQGEEEKEGQFHNHCSVPVTFYHGEEASVQQEKYKINGANPCMYPRERPQLVDNSCLLSNNRKLTTRDFLNCTTLCISLKKRTTQKKGIR
jgi:hypothetical protein